MQSWQGIPRALLVIGEISLYAIPIIRKNKKIIKKPARAFPAGLKNWSSRNEILNLFQIQRHHLSSQDFNEFNFSLSSSDSFSSNESFSFSFAKFSISLLARLRAASITGVIKALVNCSADKPSCLLPRLVK